MILLTRLWPRRLNQRRYRGHGRRIRCLKRKLLRKKSDAVARSFGVERVRIRWINGDFHTRETPPSSADLAAAYRHTHLGLSPTTVKRLLRRADFTVESCAVTSREHRPPRLQVVTAFGKRSA